MQGSLEAAERVEAIIAAAGAGGDAQVVRTGCHGLCKLGPICVIDPDGVFYPRLSADNAERIVSTLLSEERVAEELLHTADGECEPTRRYEDLSFNRLQRRLVLRNCGTVDPEDIGSAIEHGVYSALRATLTTMEPEQVLAAVERSGLRGRGGAGFPTGTKWRRTSQSPHGPAWVICNADEGDPSSFMDRSILEGDPHSVVEGVCLAAFATGATEAMVYVRSEYQLALSRIRSAIEQARHVGLLGDRILGTAFSLDIQVRQGAGAYICGEETALIASIEGRRGEPRPRPPYPAETGLWNRATCVNNVETLAAVPWIISEGAEAYASVGPAVSPGTKVFSVSGEVRYGGLVEVPTDASIAHIVYDIAGGPSDGRHCKAVQLGGPGGECVPREMFDRPLFLESEGGYRNLAGSGGVVALSDRTCMVDLVRMSLLFTQRESCGKCVPCRVGTKRMLELVTRMTEGKAAPEDLDLLESLSHDVKRSSLCGLGRCAPNPVLSSLRHFRVEFEDHVTLKRCHAGACTRLVTFDITDACNGCGACKKSCPVGAITGVTRAHHEIDAASCIRCALCEPSCPVSAIIRI